MFIKFLLLLVMFVLSVNAGCVCNEKGIDHCARCKEPIFVRPKPRYTRPNPELNLTPIGDTCSCNKLFVEPAVLPKQPCNKKPLPTNPPCNCASSSSSSSYYPPSPPPAHRCSSDYYKPAPLPPRPPPPPRVPPAHAACGCSSGHSLPVYSPTYITYESKPQDNAIPADPISISLALQRNKANAVPEAKLAFGFAKTPIDSSKKITSDVPEENFFKLKSNVITFKKPTLAPSPPSAEVEEYDEEQSRAESADGPTLTYQQLGYVPERFKNPKLRKISTHYRDDYYSHEAQALPDKVTVDCGYRPGRIAAYIKRTNKQDQAQYY